MAELSNTTSMDFGSLFLGSSLTKWVQEGMGYLFYHPFIFAIRRMFILVSPNETSFETLKDCPDYVQQALPYFFLFIFIELGILLYQGRSMRLNDSMSSLVAGVFSILPSILFRPIELATYVWFYENYHVAVLPWDNPLTWLAALFGVDFCYYWIHRFAHEVNFMWAAHQVHHSSEEYNLTTALRQSVLQNYSSWIFYLPMALCFPPSVFLIHKQFNLLYQFWIHTELITELGPLELILNTASHHRVHHGANRYCIDKNYAGVFIIWDRMFNTFEKEKSERPVYGLVSTDDASWDTVYIQFGHWQHLIQTCGQMEGFWNKLAVFWKGPGWSPGKPRMGEAEDIPETPTRLDGKYDRSVPVFFNLYACAHFVTCLVFYVLIAAAPQEEYLLKLGGTVFLIWTLSDIGFIYEHKWFTAYSEMMRCLAYLAFDFFSLRSSDSLSYIPRSLYLFSTSVWLVNLMQLPDRKPKMQ